MTNSSIVLHRPSILELARKGNFRAIAYWINSLLGPYGIYIRATTSRSGHLNILVDFHQARRREFYVGLRKHLVRFICYRLWTLNSEQIRDVRIVARIAGEPDILWKQSIRIVTPANREVLRQQPDSLRHLTRRRSAWLRFRLLRSAFVSRLAVASFFLCYWLIYWEMAGKHAPERPSAVLTSNALAQEQPAESSSKGQVRLDAPSNVPIEDALLKLGESIQQDVAAAAIAQQFEGHVVAQINPVNGEKVVALTFDDGPWEGTTEQVLDVLRQNNVKATFFWVGQQVRNNPEVAKKVVAGGHAIGNHTWRHIMHDVDQLTAADEIGNTARLIYETTGVRTNLFRPPGGNMSGSMVPYAQQQKNIITLWSVESEDYYVSAPIIVDNVLRGVHPGSIVLLHDGGGDRSETVQALQQIITALKRQGYKFVTVPELLTIESKGDVAGSFQNSLPGYLEQVPSMPFPNPTGEIPSQALPTAPYSPPTTNDNGTKALPTAPYSPPTTNDNGTNPPEVPSTPMPTNSVPTLDGGIPGTGQSTPTDVVPTEQHLNPTGEVPGVLQPTHPHNPAITPMPGGETDAMESLQDFLVGQR